MTNLPALFVSHGAPLLAIEDTPAHRFLAGLAPRLGRPRAILVATAHWCTEAPLLGSAAKPETIHDFNGFPPALYALRYPAPGAPAIAAAAVAALAREGIMAGEDAARGLDHGSWVPLMLMYPEADIPVAQITIQPARDPAHHYRIGVALRGLREQGVLILGSGSFTHNLPAAFRAMRQPGAAGELPFTAPFVDWIGAQVQAGNTDSLLAYREQAPHAQDNHPTDEHFLPFFVALGAGTPGHVGERWHHGLEFSLAMDCYAFA